MSEKCLVLDIYTLNKKEGIFNFHFFAALGCLHLEPFHQPFFFDGFFEIGSHELFSWAGFEP
jgi:hypothetical protein